MDNELSSFNAAKVKEKVDKYCKDHETTVAEFMRMNGIHMSTSTFYSCLYTGRMRNGYIKQFKTALRLHEKTIYTPSKWLKEETESKISQKSRSHEHTIPINGEYLEALCRDYMEREKISVNDFERKFTCNHSHYIMDRCKLGKLTPSMLEKVIEVVGGDIEKAKSLPKKQAGPQEVKGMTDHDLVQMFGFKRIIELYFCARYEKEKGLLQ